MLHICILIVGGRFVGGTRKWESQPKAKVMSNFRPSSGTPYKLQMPYTVLTVDGSPFSKYHRKWEPCATSHTLQVIMVNLMPQHLYPDGGCIARQTRKWESAKAMS
ncbi:hypothetical protein AVEN_223720-1 [Araneus ventricosus]|uniref:Uncharacterized protein n=1 Tax=Araneus ventricosus TaxID=182803 RepID=A0A4Y2UG12_ARAVE|nr:hypothetical protein AVEN_223720-1 [Araneus ventricosus]